MSITATARPTRRPTAASPPGDRFLRRWALTLTVVLTALFTTVTALTLAMWFARAGDSETNPVLDLAFFALGGLLIAGGIASQIRAPRRHVAGLQQALVALVALAAAGLAGNRIEPFVGALVLLGFIAPLVVSHPSRRALLTGGAGLSRPLAGLAAAAAVPAGMYAGSLIAAARDAGPSCFLGQCALGDRFAEIAALAMAICVVTALAGLRTPGWTQAAFSAAAAALLLGITSLALPGEAGAVGAPWAAAVLVWSVLVGLAAQRERGGRSEGLLHGVALLVGSGHKIVLLLAPFAVAGVALNIARPDIFAVGGPPPALRAVAVAVLVPGVVVWLWSAVLIVVRVPKRQLITDGPYALVKHPLYTGVALLVLPAVGVLLDSWLGAVLGLVLYAASRRYAPEEERRLATTFGRAWDDYCRRVKLPWL